MPTAIRTTTFLARPCVSRSFTMPPSSRRAPSETNSRIISALTKRQFTAAPWSYLAQVEHGELPILLTSEFHFVIHSSTDHLWGTFSLTFETFRRRQPASWIPPHI